VTIVSNSSPLIAFARAQELELLHKTLKEIVIPEAVYQEVVVKGRGKPGAEEVSKARWIRVQLVSDRNRVQNLPKQLELGEAEAIILAEELRAALILDDPRGRAEAKKRDVKLLSSLNILLEAKTRGIIPSVKESLDKLIASGFRLSKTLYTQVLQVAGE
jgi:predicted nucleic acid-binding protein